MKICGRCKEEKPVEFFAKRSAAKDGLSAWCKRCFQVYDRERYHNGDKARKEKNRLAQVDRKRQLLWNILVGSKCDDCGTRDPEVLEFDHRDSLTKSFNVSEMMWSHSWDSIYKEIQKCDIVCANCHRKRTIQQLGFWRGKQLV